MFERTAMFVANCTHLFCEQCAGLSHKNRRCGVCQGSPFKAIKVGPAEGLPDEFVKKIDLNVAQSIFWQIYSAEKWPKIFGCL
jgi:hypothetical protein